MSKVGVKFSEDENWSDLSSNYFQFKEMLTKKYGEPSEVTEEFDTDYLPDDRFRMMAVKSDRCTYVSSFEVDNGTIELMINYSVAHGAYIVLLYWDGINSASARAAAIDDL